MHRTSGSLGGRNKGKGASELPFTSSDTGHSADDPVSLGEAITPVILRLRGGLPRLKVGQATIPREEVKDRRRD